MAQTSHARARVVCTRKGILMARWDFPVRSNFTRPVFSLKPKKNPQYFRSFLSRMAFLLVPDRALFLA